MKKLLVWQDLIWLGLVAVLILGTGAFVPDRSRMVWLVLVAVALILCMRIAFALFKGIQISHSPVEKKIQERAQLDLVAKSKSIAEENSKKIARYSAIFVHIKGLIAQTKEEEILKTFVDLLSKVLQLTRVTWFEMAEDQTCLVSRYSTDIHVSSGKPIKILVDENTVLGYAAKFKEGYEEDQVKKNVKIAHLSCTAPVVMKLCVPISYDRSFLGIVNIAERKNMEFTKEDSQFFSTVCNLLGLAIQNARNLRLIEDSLLRVEARMAQTTELNQRIRELFGKFTSPNVVNALIENQADIQIGGENKEITILFCDIRGFTTYCEKRTPEEVVDILNEYLTKMSQVIIKYDGTLDKYIGDEIMAFWGAPLTQPQHARLAVQAGYEMMLELKKLEIAWRKAGREPFGMGLGINTGTSIVGNIGSNLRMDYTVIGDNVNLCSRVQSLTRKFNANFLITDHTYNYVKDIVKARKIGVLQVKGKSEPVMIFAVEWVDLKPLAG